ncbi:MAG: hypothetical protein F6K25_08930 [Okeania sp. SIO2G4]|uniref:hypothetical protein n=1 Tax=unclassified Okeania TaxID=2634635 RepID=UPI0013BBAE9E|nr:MULTISPECIES: hypothetical protein [unclassified Okeania]NEP72215.1 hypothetical protein [Okeania sp. SIO2G5]NEP94668.1 hypothetical protein [Okeania sp. SIO2F5]NEQ90829.1 hypothetical protein [Okeania sp. SIO2G4]
MPENQRFNLFAGDTLYNCETLNKGQQAIQVPELLDISRKEATGNSSGRQQGTHPEPLLGGE